VGAWGGAGTQVPAGLATAWVGRVGCAGSPRLGSLCESGGGCDMRSPVRAPMRPAAGYIALAACALLTARSAGGAAHLSERRAPRRQAWCPLSWQPVENLSIEAVCHAAAASQNAHREGLRRRSTRKRERQLPHELRDSSTCAYKGARALVGRVRADARIGWAHLSGLTLAQFGGVSASSRFSCPQS